MSNALFDQLRQLNLPGTDYAVFGSGPLAVRGVIPVANDLDILCGPESWKRVQKVGVEMYLSDYDVTVVTIGDGALTFGTSWGIGEFDVNTLIETAETIDGLRFVLLEHVIRYKEIRSSS